MDRVPEGQRGRHVRFLGEASEVPEGPLQLAALSGAPIIVVLGRRLGFLHYEIEVSDAVSVPRRPSPEELDEAAQRVASRIESFVSRHPTDWFHFTR
jgi:KDO2-lipid IV(A) lauroyltransferase